MKTYEARIRILEEERDGLEKSNKEMEVKLHYAVEEVSNSIVVIAFL